MELSKDYMSVIVHQAPSNVAAKPTIRASVAFAGVNMIWFCQYFFPCCKIRFSCNARIKK